MKTVLYLLPLSLLACKLQKSDSALNLAVTRDCDAASLNGVYKQEVNGTTLEEFHFLGNGRAIEKGKGNEVSASYVMGLRSALDASSCTLQISFQNTADGKRLDRFFNVARDLGSFTEENATEKRVFKKVEGGTSANNELAPSAEFKFLKQEAAKACKANEDIATFIDEMPEDGFSNNQILVSSIKIILVYQNGRVPNETELWVKDQNGQLKLARISGLNSILPITFRLDEAPANAVSAHVICSVKSDGAGYLAKKAEDQLKNFAPTVAAGTNNQKANNSGGGNALIKTDKCFCSRSDQNACVVWLKPDNQMVAVKTYYYVEPGYSCGDKGAKDLCLSDMNQEALKSEACK